MRNVAYPLSALLALIVILTASRTEAQQEVPREIMDGAEAATQVLGQQVLKGNFSFAIQKMYPRYLERAAKQAGGKDKLVAQLQEVPKQMQANGITMLEFRAGKPTHGFSVRGVLARDDKGNEGRVFREWLVFVPTTTIYRVIDRRSGAPKVRKLAKYGFQVAICDGEKKEFTFISGSNLKVAELRSFFPSLPEDEAQLGMPKVGGKELE